MKKEIDKRGGMWLIKNPRKTLSKSNAEKQRGNSLLL